MVICHLFLLLLQRIHTISVLYGDICSLSILIFLEISSVSHSVSFLYFCTDTEEVFFIFSCYFFGIRASRCYIFLFNFLFPTAIVNFGEKYRKEMLSFCCLEIYIYSCHLACGCGFWRIANAISMLKKFEESFLGCLWLRYLLRDAN